MWLNTNVLMCLRAGAGLTFTCKTFASYQLHKIKDCETHRKELETNILRDLGSPAQSLLPLR